MNKFLNKIELERKALKVINSTLKTPRLHGLSKSSIDKWYSSHPDQPITYTELIQLSASLSALNERSGERLDDKHELNVRLSKELISKIERDLDNYHLINDTRP